MKIIMTKHVMYDKIPLLERKGFRITLHQIRKTVNDPDYIDGESDAPNIIASKDIDNKHILRVVYKVESAIIKIITVYPAKKGRYH